MINVEMKTVTERGVESLIQSQAYDSYLVSTKFVGDGSNHQYETLVFRFDILMGEIQDYNEYDSKVYNTIDDAKLGHKIMVQKWQNEIRDVNDIKHYYDYWY